MQDSITTRACYLEFDPPPGSPQGPAGPLAGALDCAFLLRDTGCFSQLSQTEFPSPLTTLRFAYDAQADGPQPLVSLTRPGTAPRRRTAPEHGWVIGAKFSRLVDTAPLHADTQMRAQLLGLHREIMQPGLPLPDLEAAMHAATEMLCLMLSLPGPSSRAAATARPAQISPRTARRHFRSATGLSPKQHQRTARFHSALAELARNSGPLSHIAFDCDFADQPHFTRDFRSLSGQTPRQFRTRWQDHSVRFVQDRPPGSTIRLAIIPD